jgi:hypothetical protein
MSSSRADPLYDAAVPLSVSWVRAYHTRRLERASEIIGKLEDAGVVTPQDDTKIGFFDIQALRSSHFATGLGPRLSVRLDDEEEPLVIRSHLLAHASGFIVIRLTASSIDNPTLEGAEPRRLAELERLPWNFRQLRWTLGEVSFEAGLREALNVLFLAAHEILMRGRYDVAALVPLARDSSFGNKHLQSLAALGELSHPLPVSFGTCFEVVDAALATDLTGCVEFVNAAMVEATPHENPANSGVVDAASDRPWYVFENQSFVFLGSGVADGTGVFDPDRLRLIEFMTLRRGALRSIQRDTQRVLAGGRDVSRRRIDEWRLLVSTTTDDYVLHDRISVFLVPLNQHLRTSSSVRDPSLLEQQVRRNIDAFQTRIELASQSVSTLIGALFAVVAAVLGVGSVIRVAAAAHASIPVSEFPDAHPWLNSSIDILVTVLAFALTFVFIRRAGSRVPALRPFRRMRREDGGREPEDDWR